MIYWFHFAGSLELVKKSLAQGYKLREQPEANYIDSRLPTTIDIEPILQFKKKKMKRNWHKNSLLSINGGKEGEDEEILPQVWLH